MRRWRRRSRTARAAGRTWVAIVARRRLDQRDQAGEGGLRRAEHDLDVGGRELVGDRCAGGRGRGERRRRVEAGGPGQQAGLGLAGLASMSFGLAWSSLSNSSTAAAKSPRSRASSAAANRGSARRLGLVVAVGLPAAPPTGSARPTRPLATAALSSCRSPAAPGPCGSTPWNSGASCPPISAITVGTACSWSAWTMDGARVDVEPDEQELAVGGVGDLDQRIGELLAGRDPRRVELDDDRVLHRRADRLRLEGLLGRLDDVRPAPAPPPAPTGARQRPLTRACLALGGQAGTDRWPRAG